MAKRDDRRLLVCEGCGAAYPGFRAENGEFKIIGGPACPNCGATEFAEVDEETPEER